MTVSDYDAVRAWARAAHQDWQERKDADVRAVMPTVRYRRWEGDRGCVGRLGFDTWQRNELSLKYSTRTGRGAHRPQQMRVTADDIANGRIQVKVGHRYKDIREVIA